MNTNLRFSVIFSAIFLASLTFACSGSEDGGGGSNECNAGNTGFTECNFGMEECQPGQYCNAEMLTCSVGCTSDVNCASNQFCNLDSGSPGTCENCVVQEQETSTSGGSSCADSVDKMIACGFLESADRAAAITTCDADSDGDSALVMSCIESAGDDCEQIATCIGADSSGGGGGGGGGMPGSCTEDADCEQTPGLTHQICSGGFCMSGCRDNDDCGQDYICDDFSSQCVPDDFG
jgi:hypothetical protein